MVLYSEIQTKSKTSSDILQGKALIRGVKKLLTRQKEKMKKRKDQKEKNEKNERKEDE